MKSHISTEKACNNKEQRRKDLAHGSLWDKFLLFAIPLAATSIMQQLFNTADVAVAGRFLGNTQMAAIGSDGPVLALFINSLVGLSVGVNVALAQYIGRRVRRRVRQTVHTALILGVWCGALVFVISQILTHPLLIWMGVPADVIPAAELYLRIYFIGIPFMTVFNFSAAICRSEGNATTPLLFLAVACVINGGLDLLLTKVFLLGIQGIAASTAAANVVSMLLMIRYLVKHPGELQVSRKHLLIDKAILRRILKIGVPAGLQSIVFTLSNLCIQSAINALGADTMAGSAAAYNIEILIFYVISAFGQANVTVIGQSYGAGNIRRCIKATRESLGMCLVIVCVLAAVTILFANELLALFNPDPNVIAQGYIRILYVVGTYPLLVIMELISSSLRGLGHSLMPAATCVVGVCVLRILWVFTVFRQYMTFRTLCLVYPITWVLTGLVLVIAYLVISRKLLKRGEENDTAADVLLP